jgi:hypothetical protein
MATVLCWNRKQIDDSKFESSRFKVVSRSAQTLTNTDAVSDKMFKIQRLILNIPSVRFFVLYALIDLSPEKIA